MNIKHFAFFCIIWLFFVAAAVLAIGMAISEKALPPQPAHVEATVCTWEPGPCFPK